MKPCSKCKEVKPLTEFYPRKSGKRAGLPDSQCIACQKIAYQPRLEKEREGNRLKKLEWDRNYVTPTHKHCNGCNRDLEIATCFNIRGLGWMEGKPRSRCRECEKKESLTWIENNKDRKQKYTTWYYSEVFVRGPKHVEAFKKYYIKNRQKLLQYQKEYREKNPEKVKEREMKYRKTNVAYLNSVASSKRAYKRKATPTYANINKIVEIYKYCRQISEETGVDHCVDHIIPMTGKLVCGLHIETNLRVITRSENSKKSNKFDESMLNIPCYHDTLK